MKETATDHPSLVSIITVNYNGWKETCEMIESFRHHEPHPYEIIVVDNASHGDDFRQIAARCPEVKLVRSERNLGFAGGNNLGIAKAVGKYLFFINNDTLIKEPVLGALVGRMQQNKQIGGVSPMLKYVSEPDLVQYAGFTALSPVTLRNKMIGEREADRGQYSTACRTGALHGAAMMISREVLRKVGEMTAVYFLFYEEFDWSMRIERAGYELWYEPAAVVYHKESTTIKRNTTFREYYLSRARILFARRLFTGATKWLSCCYLCAVAAPKKSMVYAWHGEFKLAMAVLRGTAKGLFLPLG
ncbi:MAG: glycosyltransferase family 2 protein [Prevotellaceae bacterium]|jgi:GT2 family glycosyltransferase|nr:glycosyltransferase family 2 protein [Prevotellaceae bacterium]